MTNSITIISGKQGEGKSTLLKRIIDELGNKGLKPGGIFSHGTWKNGLRDEIYAKNLYTGEEIIFCLRNHQKDWVKSGNFYLNPSYIEFSLSTIYETNCDYFILDEVGKFELDEKGWFDALTFLLKHSEKPMIIVVRDSFLKEVLKKFSFQPEKVIIIERDKTKPVENILPKSFMKLIDKKGLLNK